MTSPQRHDVWASGAAYEPYVGRWSRLVARQFLTWLTIPAGARWLDVGCGTGAVSQTIVAMAAPAGVVGIDPATGFVTYARAHTAADRLSVAVGDAQALPARAASFDAAVAGLVLNFVPTPARAVVEMVRVVRPSGRVAAYVWDYAGQMQLMRSFWDAATALDSGAGELDEGRRFPLCQPEPLATLFHEAGLTAVAVQAIDVPTLFRDFDDYWAPFLGGQGPAPGYCRSLDETKRRQLRAHLRATLPQAADGTIPLQARAWAVQGTRP